MTIFQRLIDCQFVLPYGKEELHLAIAYGASRGARENEPVLPNTVAKLDTVKYLHGYLMEYCREEAYQARTIVVEQNYIDRDFMREYTGYHASTFQEVEKKTTRLHFFSHSFDFKTFEQILASPQELESKSDNNLLESNYLGFIVIRPMRTGFIGRSCLRHYPKDKQNRRIGLETSAETAAAVRQKRFYTVLRNYESNLYGLKLSVDSIAFQEQDSVVGLCASSAIYALLHGVKRLFDTPILCGLEITRMATKYAAPANVTATTVRALPNTGLTLAQIFQTLTEVELTPLMLGLSPETPHRSQRMSELYAYLSAGIPVLAYVALVGQAQLTELQSKIDAAKAKLDGQPVNYNSHRPKRREKLVSDLESALENVKQDMVEMINDAPKHAFTLTGYSLDTKDVLQVTDGESRSQMSSAVKKVYVHCDRIGPFSKFWVDQRFHWLAFRPNAIHEAKDQKSTSDHAYPGIAKRDQVLAIPIALFVPITEKLRLDFASALRVLDGLTNITGLRWGDVVWDIKVATVPDIRSAWRDAKQMNPIHKVRLLRRDLPKFCWRVVATDPNGLIKLEVVLDCTAIDIPESIIEVALHEDGAELLATHVANKIEEEYNRSDINDDEEKRILLKLFSKLREAAKEGEPPTKAAVESTKTRKPLVKPREGLRRPPV
jgi:hypothetical protein